MVGQGREIRRYLFGQHREDLRRRVDRRRIVVCMIVDRRAALDQRIDIRHRHQQLRGSFGERLGRRHLIEIERVVVVDRQPGQAAKVADARLEPARVLDRIRLLQRCWSEIGEKSAIEHRLSSDTPEVVDAGSHLEPMLRT